MPESSRGGHRRKSSLTAVAGPAVGSVLFLAFPTILLSEETPSSARESVARRDAPLRNAIHHLIATYGDRYPKGSAYLTRLEEIERSGNRAEAELLRREALVAHPLVRSQPILFVVRPQYWGFHGPINTMFQNGEIQEDVFRGGGAVKTLDLSAGGEIKTLLEVPEGVARDPEVSFDGQRIAFAMRRNRRDDYHIYEMNADGSGLRQLTFGSKLSDVEPMYLPDGRIVFNSTRDLKFCQCNRHPMGNLFVMDADGANMIQIGGSNLWEGHPSLTPYGNILYSRWEYVDRHFGPSFGLWTMNPDGTHQALFYGNNAWAPGSILNARVIPGTRKVLCIYGACHDLPWGALAVVDRARGLDGSDPVERIWPADTRKWLENQRNADWHPNDIDLFARTHPKYEDPYPLSERCFLSSRLVREKEMGIFLLDWFGNEVLLHAEPPGCFDPMPLTSRTPPPAVPFTTDFRRNEGRFYVYDVYTGTGMESVPRGAIKYLRVVEAPPKRAWTRPGQAGIDADQAPGMNWNLTNNKRVIGDVPVEKDGSAYFSVPANTFLYFLALDENRMMIQAMRSGTLVQPGETVGCVGCHESRDAVVPNRPKLAWTRPPKTPRSWYGAPREFNYLTEVQPVFDEHCVSCHDYGKEAGEVLNLAGDVGLLFNTSYLELHRRSAIRWSPDKPGDEKLLIKAVHDGPPAVLPPFAWGSHRSRLVDVVRAEHYGVELDREELDRIVTWIDLNAPYYGSYTSVYPRHPFGRSPLATSELNRISELVGEKVNAFKHEPSLQMSFSRPSVSPLLARFESSGSPGYREALRLIEVGRRRLELEPREDMLGPRSGPRSPQDVERNDRHLVRQRDEVAARKALLERHRYYASQSEGE